jgi:AcrR family transcriptional regulator
MTETSAATPPEIGLRERKKQETRRRIAETARRLFSERGFDQVTVAEVARAADVSTQTVFNYFATKEDLVYWRLGAFEEHLLAAVRDRPPGESALAAFRGFLLDMRGLVRSPEPGAAEQLEAMTRMIAASPALLAREQQIYAQYTDAIAALLAGETSADPGDLEPWIAANALTGVHRALVAYVRGRVLDGASHPELGDDTRARAEHAFALLEHGLGAYAVKAPERGGQ